MMGFLSSKEGNPSRVMWLLCPTGVFLVLSCTLGMLPACTWQRSSRGGWKTPGIASGFPSTVRCCVTGSAPGVPHCCSPLAAPSWLWDCSSSNLQSLISLRLSMPFQARMFRQGKVSTDSEQKVLGFANPQRRISHEEGHHNALPQGMLLPAGNPVRIVGFFFPPSPVLVRHCLAIDSQLNPLSPDNFLNRSQSAARRGAGRCWVTVVSGSWRKAAVVQQCG